MRPENDAPTRPGAVRGRADVILDIAACLFVVGIGVVAIVEGGRHSLGRIAAIGPGFFPVALGTLLVLSGFGILIETFLRRQNSKTAEQEPPVFKVRATIFILAGILAFAALVDRAGLIPAVMAAVMISALAEPGQRPLSIFLLALAMALGTVGIFVYGLALQVQPLRF